MNKNILVIDCGNTQAKFGHVSKDEGLTHSHAIINSSLLEANFDLQAELNKSGFPMDGYVSAVLSSVVPKVSKRLSEILPLEILHIDHNNCGDLVVDMPSPNEVGADRLVNAYAAKSLYGSKQIIIDFGTATTFDIVNDKGHYYGGLILPGIDLSIETLHKATAKLPLISIAQTETLIGKTTEQAMNKGLYWGYISMIEGLLKRLEPELGYNCTVTATGGYAQLLMHNCSIIDQVDIELTLKGLHLIAQRYWTL